MTGNSKYKKIWSIVNKIPYGSAMSYGAVAMLAGFPRCARVVSAALRAAPPELELPWYRVINAQGKISFPENSQKYKIQKERLVEEGLFFASKKIKLSDHLLVASADEVLWRQ